MTTLTDLSASLADTVERLAPTIVGLRGQRFHGTGVSLGDHRFVTASRGLATGEALTVRLPDGTTTEGRVVAREPGVGLALVQADGADVPAATFADGTPRVGQLGVLVGRGERLTAALGLVSDVGPAWATPTGARVDAWIDVDASLPWGFPGGPLVDADGHVLGINVRDLSRGGTTVPASTVQRVVASLAERGEHAPGYLGVGAVPVALANGHAAAAGQAEGLLVVSLDGDGPAANALAIGDVILSLDGVGVASVPGLQGRLNELGSAHATTIRVLRGLTVSEVAVTLGARPNEGGGRGGWGRWGRRGHGNGHGHGR